MAKQILTKASVDKAILLQKRLAEAYLPFFQYAVTFLDELGKQGRDEKGRYTPKRQVREASLARAAIGYTKRSIRLIAKVYLSETKPEDKDLQELNFNLDIIQQNYDDIVQLLDSEEQVAGKLDDALSNLGLSARDLDMRVKAQRKRRQSGRAGLRQGFGIPYFKTIAAYGGLKAVTQALGPLMGPLYGPLSLLGDIGFGVGRGGIGLYNTLFNREKGGPIGGGITDFSFLEDDVPMGQPAAAPAATAAGPSISPAAIKSSITGGISAGLFDFFNDGALKAKYTARALRALETMAGQDGKGGKSSWIGKLGDTFKSVLAGMGLSGGLSGLLSSSIVKGLAKSSFAIAAAAVTLYAGKVLWDRWEKTKDAVGEFIESRGRETGFTQKLLDQARARREAGDFEGANRLEASAYATSEQGKLVTAEQMYGAITGTPIPSGEGLPEVPIGTRNPELDAVMDKVFPNMGPKLPTREQLSQPDPFASPAWQEFLKELKAMNQGGSLDTERMMEPSPVGTSRETDAINRIPGE